MVVSLITGVLGSLHCVGMCGPLALALPLGNTSSATKFTGTLIYNLGRIVTYSMLGLFMGLAGQTFALFGVQQYLSVAAGILIIVFVLLPKRKTDGPARGAMAFFSKIRSMMGRLFTRKSKSSLLVIGLLNGLLPCGLVYMALAASAATGSIVNGMLFMAFFGLGTLPAMWTLAFWGNYIGLPARRTIRRLFPYMMTLVASLLILRGMGLDIPFVSPALKYAGEKPVIECHTQK